MGMNSAILILNDALNEIEANPLEFTAGVVRAIKMGSLGTGKHEDISIKGFVNAASLFHMAHADFHDVYVIGSNNTRRIPGGGIMYSAYRDPKEVDEELLRSMADAAGFRLVKKSTLPRKPNKYKRTPQEIAIKRAELMNHKYATAAYWNGDDWGSIDGIRSAENWVNSQLDAFKRGETLEPISE